MSAYELFWENSKLAPETIGEWQRRVDEWAAREHEPAALRYAGADIPLPRARDALQRTLRRRASSARFGPRPLTMTALGRLLDACAGSAAGRRTYASAGATYPVELFCLLENVAGPLRGSACYYNADNHSLAVAGRLPPWEQWRACLNLDCDVPAVVFVFAVFPERVTAKYGDRGGRFALIEVGHACQNLALRAARERLAGVEAGGLADDSVKALLGLAGTTAQIALGYAVGTRRRHYAQR